MCAIAGILSTNRAEPPQEEALRLMLRRMAHRGPDGGGTWSAPGVALGARRLVQLDAAGGAQPMTSPCGRWTLVFNGEIHNHRALRQELASSWRFITVSDTEVLLAALVVWGERALLKLNGMFAFFLWDEKAGRALAARDRLGVKPFVYLKQGTCFAFASEAKALLDLLPARPAMHLPGVLEYLVAPCFSGVAHPMFEGLEHLAPGHLLRFGPEGIKTEAWWTYDLRQAVNDDAISLTSSLHHKLPEAVTLTMDADHLPAVFLSGGLDSTLVAACAQRQAAMHGYTIAFEGQAGFDYAQEMMVKSDDLPFAVQSAAEIGMRHELVPVRRVELAADLRTLAVQNDALPAWEQELAQHHLAKAAARNHRAVLVGDAADETHFGYGFLLDERATSSAHALVERFGTPPPNPAWQAEAANLVDGYRDMALAAGLENETRAGRLRCTTHLVVQRWLPRLLHNGDIHTMAHGLEARVPFADTGLIDLAVTVHPELALKDGTEKWLLREAARGLMPEVNRLRRKSSLSKDSQCATVYQAETTKALNESSPLIGFWLDVPSLRALCTSGLPLTEPQRALLFRVICLHHWARHYHVRLP